MDQIQITGKPLHGGAILLSTMQEKQPLALSVSDNGRWQATHKLMIASPVRLISINELSPQARNTMTGKQNGTYHDHV